MNYTLDDINFKQFENWEPDKIKRLGEEILFLEEKEGRRIISIYQEDEKFNVRTVESDPSFDKTFYLPEQIVTFIKQIDDVS